MKISEFTVPELKRLEQGCNFTALEMQCFKLKAKDCTNVELAMKLNISESTVSVTMRKVRSKITRLLEWSD